MQANRTQHRMNPVELIKYFLRFVVSNRRKKYGRTFDGEELFSANYQDLAVINLFKHKRNGTYVEIGAQDPVKRSNTFALEINYGWRGLSFELDPEYVHFFNRFRKNKCIEGDATEQHYSKLFEDHAMPAVIDFLQIDIDPPSASLAVLKQMPFDEFKFSFITFEHDLYEFGAKTAEQQREFLAGHGYIPLALDVSQENRSFEDWWISPELFATLKVSKKLPARHRDCRDLAIWFREL